MTSALALCSMPGFISRNGQYHLHLITKAVPVQQRTTMYVSTLYLALNARTRANRDSNMPEAPSPSDNNNDDEAVGLMVDDAAVVGWATVWYDGWDMSTSNTWETTRSSCSWQTALGVSPWITNRSNGTA